MKKIILSILCLNLLSVQAQSWNEIDKIVASDRGAGDQFGSQVAISGNYAVVGAPRESEDVSGGNTLDEAGSAYIYEKNGSGNWVFKQKIVGSHRAAYDSFGTSVAIDGDYIAVGAPFNGTDASGVNQVNNSGGVYLFELNGSGTWVQIQKIVASDRAIGDNFGSSVALSNKFLISGASFEDEDASGGATLANAGSAYIFEQISGTWIQQQKIVASDRGAGDRFGMSVSISGDYAIVGTRFDGKNAGTPTPILTQAGSAYIFERNTSTNTWSQATKIVASDRQESAYFGNSVSISGDYAVVGAPAETKDVAGSNPLSDAGAVYVFERNGGVWSQQQKMVAGDREAFDYFGWDVSVSGIRTIVGAKFEDHNAAGGSQADEAGSAYFFERNGGTWSQQQKIVASDRSTGDEFGSGVAINNSDIIIGAPREAHDASGGNSLSNAGSAYIFSLICTPATATDIQVACNTFTWTNGNGQTYTSSTSTPTHVIQNGAANGCDSIVTLNLTINPITTVTTNSSDLTADQTGGTYQWIDCDNGNTPISGETSQTFVPAVSGNYAVEVTAGGCTATSSCVAFTVVGIENNQAVLMTSIYPNPTEGNFTVNSPVNMELTITDVTGRVISTATINAGENQLSLNEMQGVFLLNFVSDNGQFTKRITIK